ncbi:hypothetical protein BJF81_02325 [Ornithinimicrobium sp. CNJ-824]|nr:hypothetical protein BJF81_02325 [Ornithinimicrobium sp. CNJ-824]
MSRTNEKIIPPTSDSACPSWCESERHEPGQRPQSHWRVLVRQVLPAGDHEEVFSVWLGSSETEPEPSVALRVGGGVPRAVELESLLQLRQELDVAIEAVTAARTATCTDCGKAFAPFEDEEGEGRDEGACLRCRLERQRARRPRLVRSAASAPGRTVAGQAASGSAVALRRRGERSTPPQT